MANRYSNGEMLTELRRVAGIVGGPLSGPEYQRRGGRIHRGSLAARFGSWLNALAAADLESPYTPGGQWFRCPICGGEFRSTNGKKARKTCSLTCTKHLQQRRRFKGDAASKSAARGRAHKYPTQPCEMCGHDGSVHRIERHHKDGNVYHNDRSNIAMLCTLCHVSAHGHRGEQHVRAKFSDDAIVAAVERVTRGETIRAVAKDVAMNAQYLGRLVNGHERRSPRHACAIDAGVPVHEARRAVTRCARGGAT